MPGAVTVPPAIVIVALRVSLSPPVQPVPLPDLLGSDALSQVELGELYDHLEFAAPDLEPTAQMPAPDGRAVWVYRMP